MSETAREIRSLRFDSSKIKSPALTGRLSRYSINPKASNIVAAAPKLQRHATSANPKDGCPNIARKPSRVGERFAMGVCEKIPQLCNLADDDIYQLERNNDHLHDLFPCNRCHNLFFR